MARLLFKQHAKIVSVSDGSELLQASRIDPSLPLRFGCQKGQCGTCLIHVAEGVENLSRMTKQEKETLLAKGKGEGFRLACQCAILHSDVTID